MHLEMTQCAVRLQSSLSFLVCVWSAAAAFSLIGSLFKLLYSIICFYLSSPQMCFSLHLFLRPSATAH